jgi:thymidylate synthase ThyX
LINPVLFLKLKPESTMEVKLLTEHGLEEALLGLSLSYNCAEDKDMLKVANKLAHQDGGHNVFLEQIQCWFDIDAPRYWWQQFDRYRVGTTRQSESTMHTLTKRPLEQRDFEGGVPELWLNELNEIILRKDWAKAKRLIPEAFLQRRVVTINYKSLRNIVKQRKTHRLREWVYFCTCIEDTIKQPEWL